MRRFMALCGLAAALAAAGPVLADDGVQLGATYRGLIQLKTYGSPQVPLPPGDWKLVTLEESRSNDNFNTRLLTGNLIQTKGDQFAGRITFKVPDSSVRGTWVAPANCTRKDFIANYTTETGANGPFDCLYIFPTGMGRPTNPSKSSADFYDYVDKAKIRKPLTSLFIGYGVSDGRSYLLTEYWFNPDLAGVKPAGAGAWHVDHYKEDAKRAAYVESMKRWAQDWRQAVRDGYKGKLSAASLPVASLPGQPAATAPAAKPVATVAKPTMAKPVAPAAELGRTYRDVFPLNVYAAPQLPLPPGDWKLVVLDEGVSDREKIRNVRGYLIQTKGDVIAGRIYFNAPDAASSIGWPPTNNCTRKEPLANLTRTAGSAKGFDCTSITAYVLSRPQTAPRHLNKFYDYLDASGIKKPATMINVGYGLSNGQTYVTAEYMFNPEIDGVRAESIGAWRPDRYGEDTRRGAYIEKMKAWAQQWHSMVEAGYKSALPRVNATN